MAKTYVIYVRKSSESEDRQELSLQAQLDELNKLVQERSLIVARTFEESKSAKTPGRPVFAEMRALLLAGGIDGIICWKVNRLARNPIDAGQITWDIGGGTFSEIVTPGRTYTGSAEDKWSLFTEFGSATKFSDDLSDDVRRGNRTTLKHGYWPSCPKLGYVRAFSEGATFRRRLVQRLVPDPARYDIIHDVWRRVLQGEAPLDVLRWLNTDSGFRMPFHRTRGGGAMSKSGLYRLLRDEFYMGIMVANGERYLGNHQAMVSPDEFAQVQAILDGRRVGGVARPKTRVFAYRGLLRCHSCHAIVTAKVLTKKRRTYTYYHCCRKERRYSYCPEPSVQEHQIEAQIEAFIQRIKVPDAWLDELLKVLDRLADSLQGGRSAAQDAIVREESTLIAKKDRARNYLIEGVLSAAEYQREERDLANQLISLQQQKTTLAADRTDVLPWKTAFLSLKKAPLSLAGLDVLEKRHVVRSLTCYLTLEAKILHIQAKEPLTVLDQVRDGRDLSAWISDVETILAQRLRSQDSVHRGGEEATAVHPPG